MPKVHEATDRNFAEVADLLWSDWGRMLGSMISATETRVAQYRRLVQEAYRAGDRDTIAMLKPIAQDEAAWLKRLRAEKTAWNDGTWGRRLDD
jgi:N-acetylglucosamine kinase-like BadF-type ATPase